VRTFGFGNRADAEDVIGEARDRTQGSATAG
jgi:hypothetical protein